MIGFLGWGGDSLVLFTKKAKTPCYTEMYTGWITHFSSVLVVLWLFQPLPWESRSLKITPASLQSAENQNVQYVRYTHIISCNLWLAILFCGVLIFYNFCGWLDSYEKFSFTKIDASIWKLRWGLWLKTSWKHSQLFSSKDHYWHPANTM